MGAETPVESDRGNNWSGAVETNANGEVPGSTEISGTVVAAIAAYAAERVEGVVSVGAKGLLRTFTSLVETTASGKAAGVRIGFAVDQAIFDVDLVIEYGHSIPTVVEQVRKTITSELMALVHVNAKEINVTVAAIEFGGRRMGRLSVQ